jgi:hypothetical protein
MVDYTGYLRNDSLLPSTYLGFPSVSYPGKDGQNLLGSNFKLLLQGLLLRLKKRVWFGGCHVVYVRQVLLRLYKISL